MMFDGFVTPINITKSYLFIDFINMKEAFIFKRQHENENFKITD